jgi:ABC-type branched-subunit amino acid transport system ATPase component
MSVLDNLLLAFDNEDQKLVKSFFGLNSLSKEKVSEAKSALEELGLSSLETKQASELSYGQKRLVELTRAILKPHELLMLDEPVAGVTPALRKKISDSLLLLKKKGHTILLVEHDMPFTLNIADEVIVLDEGKIIASGNPKEIKKNKKVLEAYLGD